MNVESFIERLRPRRRVSGIAAALLPFETDGRVAVEAFQLNLKAAREAGLRVAVNMDTGYVNLLGEDEKLDVLGGRELRRRFVCRTFSDCTTAPRNGLPSGCYPLDPFYRETEAAARLKQIKRRTG